MTHELQVIANVAANILQDVAIDHPFRDHREPPVLEGIRDTDKSEDVGMGEVLPRGNFFTKALYHPV